MRNVYNQRISAAIFVFQLQFLRTIVDAVMATGTPAIEEAVKCACAELGYTTIKEKQKEVILNFVSGRDVDPYLQHCLPVMARVCAMDAYPVFLIEFVHAKAPLLCSFHRCQRS